MEFIKNKKISFFGILLLVFFLDRISKIYILKIAELNNEVNIQINGFINLILVWNTGIGFGLLSFEEPTIYNFITGIIILINLLIFYLIIKTKDISGLFYAIILGGSLGNLFDRLYYKQVPDFIDINYKGFHWFIFNVADIFITLAIICLIFVELLNYKKK